ncbi:MAG: Gfo/Idh/MocA family oxidoreductase [Pirellulales bacterium]|nr:Gfo/Idh/MocA family oxidoreductase [Pirellulales bacterium]
MPGSTSRRDFLARLGRSLAAVSAAGYTATARGYTANETIRVAVIGAGGRAQHLLRAMQSLSGVSLVAVCDVWDEHLAKGRELATKDAFATKDYRAVLDRPDVDAVLVATPDHWHVPITIAACEAGKDVYVEKPLTHDPGEGAAVIAAQQKSGRIVQVGMQQRSMPQFIEGRELIKSGALGTVRKVELSWNRNAARGDRLDPGIDPATVDWQRFLGSAPQQPFDAYRFRNWRWFWDFGGGVFTDLMVHFIDVAHWFLDLPEPDEAASIGDFFLWADRWQTPDTVQTLLRYPTNGVQAHFEGTFVNARDAARIEFMGTEATLYLDRGRYELVPERKSKVEPREHVIGTGPKGQDFYLAPNGEALHLANWLECIRSREQPNAPVAAGVLAAASAHLANRALRSGQVARRNA